MEKSRPSLCNGTIYRAMIVINYHAPDSTPAKDIKQKLAET